MQLAENSTSSCPTVITLSSPVIKLIYSHAVSCCQVSVDDTMLCQIVHSLGNLVDHIKQSLASSTNLKRKYTS